MKQVETKNLPRCPECGGTVAFHKAPGRTREFRRGVQLEIPSDFPIPTCMRCGEELMNAEVSDRLDALLKPLYLAQQGETVRTCVETLRARDGVTQQQIEDACGVTRSYLSHMMSGRREVSLTLMRLLEVFALNAEAFELALRGIPFDKHMIGLFAVSPRREYRTSTHFMRQTTYRSPRDFSPGLESLEPTG